MRDRDETLTLPEAVSIGSLIIGKHDTARQLIANITGGYQLAPGHSGVVRSHDRLVVTSSSTCLRCYRDGLARTARSFEPDGKQASTMHGREKDLKLSSFEGEVF
ncbi:hypothetical protein RRG08_052063 [Elysia crispata]|uniref:Uncharacterized protein n=1 Tax=Elysia crispata TaxID=231223 RepID=A0AAE1A589_9GAST|nr:hypothetical protein RRG08_052063 [Elysia crispata]